jgi:cephalosporin hydroxylase
MAYQVWTDEMKFEDLYFSHKGLVSDKWHHYFEVYDRYFSRYESPHILEIGNADGGSLELYEKWFEGRATVHGIEIDQARVDKILSVHPEWDVVCGDATDPDFMEMYFWARDWRPDIVIEDASHAHGDQADLIDIIFPRMAEGGVYICEDIHTSFIPGYEQPGREVFAHYAARLTSFVQEFHWPNNDRSWLSATDFGRNLYCMSFYDSMVVLEKRDRANLPIRPGSTAS